MKRILFLLCVAFSVAQTMFALTIETGKYYTIANRNDVNLYVKDTGVDIIQMGDFDDACYWEFIATANEGCYYVKNKQTGRYAQQCSTSTEVNVTMGDEPVEYRVKECPAEGTDIFGITSTNESNYEFTAGCIGWNWKNDNTIQTFAAVEGTNHRSFWKLTEVVAEPEVEHALSADKIYTVVCKPDFNTFMQDNGTGALLLGGESAGTLWCFEPTENANCYYVKNVKTGNYIQACPDSEVPATMGTIPVEYFIKGDAAGGQAGENFYRMTSTDRTPNDFSAGTIGLNRAGDNTKVQGFASVTGANQWSVWCIREVESVQKASLSSPFTGTEVQEGTVYLYNVESGKWLQNNNRYNPELTTQYWTTRAELGDWGLDLQLIAQEDGGYQIDPNFVNNHSINDFNLYMDTNQPVTSWKFTPKNIAGITNAYTIVAEKATLGSDVNGYLRGADLGAATWQVVTREERIQYAQLNVSAENPIDMTFLVNNPDLSNNNERAAWIVTRDGGSEGWNDNIRYNRNFWAQNFNSLDVSQTEIAVPNGTYQVCFSLMYSPTALGNINIEDYNAYKTSGDETVYAVGYANGETIKARSIYSVEGTSNVTNVHQKQVGDYFFPGGPNQLNGSMAIGNYQTEPLTVTVSNGKLTLGFKSIEGCPTTAYIGFNGIKLTYIGAAEENTVTVSVTDVGYATFVAPGYIGNVPEGVEAYAAKVCEGYVRLEPVTAIPSGEAVVLKAAEGTYTMQTSEAGIAIVLDNDLKAATDEVTADGTQYILAKVNGEAGFAKAVTGTTIAAGKGYLIISGAAGVKTFYGFEPDNATSINEELRIKNEVLYEGAPIYNVAGQRASKMQKGINIVNGKKVVR